MEHLLTLIIFIPALFGLISLALSEDRAKWMCTVGAALAFVFSIPLWIGYGDATTLRSGFDRLHEEVIEKHVAAEKAEREEAKHLVRLFADATAAVSPKMEAAFKEHPSWRLMAERAKAEISELRRATRNPSAAEMRYVEYGDWIPVFNIHYFVGVDGLSLPLVMLTTLLTLVCLVYSWHFDHDKSPEKRRPLKGFFILFLLLETGLVGVFCALDLFLFYVFWEIVLLPSYFLIGIWGGENRNYAAIKFFIYTLVGSVLMLIAMLALYFTAEPRTFNMLTLLELTREGVFPKTFQLWIFVGLFFGFAIKVPIFPFHTWLPDAHVQAPTAFSVMLAGVMLKMGGYGFFRLAYPLCPEAANHPVFIYGIAGLGLIGLVYGAFVALGQNDFKSLVAYSSVSHMGYVMLGLAALTPGAITGAALQMFNHGVSSALMFLIVGIIYERAHHRDLDKFGGLALQMPWYFGVAIIGSFASLGLPGLNGFISEFLVFFGVYQSTIIPKWMVFAALPGIVLTAVYVLWTIKRVFLGEITNPKYQHFSDMNFNEAFAVFPLAFLCVLVGVYPRVVLDIMGPTMDNILLQITRH